LSFSSSLLSFFSLVALQYGKTFATEFSSVSFAEDDLLALDASVLFAVSLEALFLSAEESVSSSASVSLPSLTFDFTDCF